MIPVNTVIREGRGERPVDRNEALGLASEAIGAAAAAGSARFGSERVMVRCDLSSSVAERYRVELDGVDLVGLVRAGFALAVLAGMAAVALRA